MLPKIDFWFWYILNVVMSQWIFKQPGDTQKCSVDKKIILRRWIVKLMSFLSLVSWTITTLSNFKKNITDKNYSKETNSLTQKANNKISIADMFLGVRIKKNAKEIFYFFYVQKILPFNCLNIFFTQLIWFTHTP